MNIGPLTREAIDFVFDHISGGSEKELELLNKTIDGERLHFYNLIGEPFTWAMFYVENKEPFALAAMTQKDKDVWVANLITAEEAWKKANFPMTHIFARFTTDFVERSGAIVEAYSPYGYGKVFDWFTTMGFRYADTANGLARYIKRDMFPVMKE